MRVAASVEMRLDQALMKREAVIMTMIRMKLGSLFQTGKCLVLTSNCRAA